MKDVCIIGGGVVGSFIARQLSRYEVSVVLLEKQHDVAHGASGANSGIVHAGFDAENGTLKAKMNVRGSALMPVVAKELGVSFINNGSLVLGFSQEDKDHIKKLYDRGIKNSVEGLRILNAEEIQELEPNVSKDAVCALYAPTGGIICPYGLTIAAMGNAMDNGVELKTDFEVTSIKRNKETYLISNGVETIEARYVVNAAGTGSAKIASMAGDNSFTITPRIGEYMICDKESGSIVHNTIFVTPSKMGKGILVSPTADGNLILGPTSENVTDAEDVSTTPAGLAKITEGVLREVPGVPLRTVITSFAGMRAVGSTGDFIINSPQKNFINVAGIESPGLTSAPAIGEYVAGMLFETGLEAKEKKDFNPYRKSMHGFTHMNAEEKNALIEKEPAFGEIVCRCEGITKGEILCAIRQNPKTDTVDGVKRRCRAGMGRCQGGFCSTTVAKIISDELNIPLHEVKKDSDGAYICTGEIK